MTAGKMTEAEARELGETDPTARAFDAACEIFEQACAAVGVRVLVTIATDSEGHPLIGSDLGADDVKSICADVIEMMGRK